jgi:hypothetical protein
MNKNKFRIQDYFDTLISRLDLAVETAISENHYDVNLINELNNKRDAFINEIRDVQAFNLKALSDLNTEPHRELTNSELFPKFCFLIQIRSDQTYTYEKLAEQEFGLKLIVTDMYLTEAQIKCYAEYFNVTRELFGSTRNFDLFIEKNNNYVNFFFFQTFVYALIILKFAFFF